MKLGAQTSPADACIRQLERDGLFIGAQDIVQPSFDEGPQRGSLLRGMSFRPLGQVVGQLYRGLHYGFPYTSGWGATLLCLSAVDQQASRLSGPPDTLG